MDFTLENYSELVDLLVKQEIFFSTLRHYFTSDLETEPFAIIRHDVDYQAEKALVFAVLEAEMDIKATYFFRAPHCRRSFNPPIIKEIESLGHEVGYHYETLDSCRGNFDAAVRLFDSELGEFRGFGFNISTICPHGNPRIKKRNYKSNGDILAYDPDLLVRNRLIGDAYNSVDFDRLVYISDVGVRFRGIGVVKDLKHLLQREDFIRMYFLIHPDYWSKSSYRAFLLWFAGKTMRAVKYNTIVSNLWKVVR